MVPVAASPLFYCEECGIGATMQQIAEEVKLRDLTTGAMEIFKIQEESVSQTSSASAGSIGNVNDAEYSEFLGRVNARFRANAEGPLFTTANGDKLFELYLMALPQDQRQYHNCHACREFISRFGGLVTIDRGGIARSAIWNLEDTPEMYVGSVRNMLDVIEKSKVTGVWVTSDSVCGRPVTGTWTHLHLHVPVHRVHKSRTLSADQVMAEKREDFKNVVTALGDFKLSILEQAVAILKSDTLDRSEKVLGPAEWLLELQRMQHKMRGQHRANVIWQAVATAPAGFCHPRSSMISTLLEDLAAGVSVPRVTANWAAKMHPLRYQRPQAAPAEGAIDAAEKLVEKMGIAGALRRRPATLADLQTIWTPPAIAPVAKEGVFGHLRDSAVQPKELRLAPQKMTWVKFAAEVLPTAQRVSVHLNDHHGPFVFFTTATDPAAPPILQWDLEGARNPVAWYFYHGGRHPWDVGLRGSRYGEVTAIVTSPAKWNGQKSAHFGDFAALIIAGCHDLKPDALGLFPETLKSDLHSVRSVIEAHSKRTPLDTVEGAPAAGLAVQEKADGLNGWPIDVYSEGLVRVVVIDRWD